MRKRKILSAFIFVVLLSVLASAPVFAATVCKIGSKKYSSLQDAVNNVKSGETIKVTKAIKAANRVEVPQKGLTFTIDFSKKKYTFTGEDFAFGISPGSKVTVKNMKLQGSKMFDVGGDLTISSGNATCGQLAATNPNNSNGTLTIKGGTFTNNNSVSSAFVVNDGTVKVSKGSFKNGSFHNNGKLTISGGTFNGGGANAIIANFGKLTISGGSFMTGSGTLRCVNNSNTLVIQGGTFSASDITININENGTATISGGTFTESNTPNLLVKGTATVKNGTFSGNIIAQGGKVKISGGKSSACVVCENNGNVTITKFTIDQGTKPHTVTPSGYYTPCLTNLGGTFLVKGGSYISPNGYGYEGKITFKVSGNYKKLFQVKTLVRNE